jgi:hypothetical protein
MNNKMISVVMLDRNYLNKQMKDLPGLAGVKEEDMPGVPGVEEEADTDTSFKDGYLKGYEQGLIDAGKTDETEK